MGSNKVKRHKKGEDSEWEAYFIISKKLKGIETRHMICALIRYKQKSKDGMHMNCALVDYLNKANENPLDGPGSFPNGRLHHFGDLPPTLRIPNFINHSHVLSLQRMRRQLKWQWAKSSRWKPDLLATSLRVIRYHHCPTDQEKREKVVPGHANQ